MSVGTRSDAAPGRLSAQLRARHDPVAVILSPPRSGSTALARSLWQHRAFRYYLHEPYDAAYHDGLALSPEIALDSVLDRGEIAGRDEAPGGSGIVVKEMTFQAAGRVAGMLGAATVPVILLVRDPRLAVSSRMARREKDGLPARFPAAEAGWRDLAAARQLLRDSGTRYIVVDISDVRRHPAGVLRAVCQRLGLAFDPGMLSWPSAGSLRLGNLNGRQDAWYERVLSSTGFQPPDELVPGDDYFRDRQMLDVLSECLRCYQDVRADPVFTSAPGHRRSWRGARRR